VIFLGYGAMVLLGLLPLAGLARYTGVEAERVFYFDLPVALALGLVMGALMCLALGRMLGLFAVDNVGLYEARRAQMAPPRTRRVTPVASTTRMRSLVTPGARF